VVAPSEPKTVPWPGSVGQVVTSASASGLLPLAASLIRYGLVALLAESLASVTGAIGALAPSANAMRTAR
jgi:hypothetical protein